MKIYSLDIQATIEKAKSVIREDTKMSAGTKSMFEILIFENYVREHLIASAFAHALCNAHHLRKLTRAWEQDDQKWAYDMKDLLEEINAKLNDAGGALSAQQAGRYRAQYRKLIKKGEIECPEPTRPRKNGKRGRIK